MVRGQGGRRRDASLRRHAGRSCTPPLSSRRSADRLTENVGALRHNRPLQVGQLGDGREGRVDEDRQGLDRGPLRKPRRTLPAVPITRARWPDDRHHLALPPCLFYPSSRLYSKPCRPPAQHRSPRSRFRPRTSSPRRYIPTSGPSPGTARSAAQANRGFCSLPRPRVDQLLPCVPGTDRVRDDVGVLSHPLSVQFDACVRTRPSHFSGCEDGARLSVVRLHRRARGLAGASPLPGRWADC